MGYRRRRCRPFHRRCRYPIGAIPGMIVVSFSYGYAPMEQVMETIPSGTVISESAPMVSNSAACMASINH